MCPCAQSLQSCLTLCDPMNCSLSGSSVHGILQARILEWVAFPSPGDLPNPGMESASPAMQVDTLPLCYLGSVKQLYSNKNSFLKNILENKRKKGRKPCSDRNPGPHSCSDSCLLAQVPEVPVCGWLVTNSRCLSDLFPPMGGT